MILILARSILIGRGIEWIPVGGVQKEDPFAAVINILGRQFGSTTAPHALLPARENTTAEWPDLSASGSNRKRGGPPSMHPHSRKIAPQLPTVQKQQLYPSSLTVAVLPNSGQKSTLADSRVWNKVVAGNQVPVSVPLQSYQPKDHQDMKCAKM